MFGAPVRTGLTLTRVLGGISKTLGIANQVIPLYREAKPMIRNARTILAVLKDMNKPSTKTNTVKNTPVKKETTFNSKPIKVVNSPSFFL